MQIKISSEDRYVSLNKSIVLSMKTTLKLQSATVLNTQEISFRCKTHHIAYNMYIVIIRLLDLCLVEKSDKH